LSSVGYAYCAEAPSCAEGVPIAKAAGQKVGLPITYSASIAAAAPNYTAQCLAAKQDHVSALWIEDGAPILVRVGADCSRQGYTPTYIVNGAAFGANLITATGLKNDLLADFTDLPYIENTPAVNAMTAAVDKYYPGLIQNANVWNQDSAVSWVSGLLLADAVKAGGLGASDTPSAAEVVQGLNSLKSDTLNGWSPPLSFTAGQPHPIDCWYTLHIQNAVPSLANGGKVTCENGSSS
jgi:branched-chain amino acid transport system substrate-binding protein